MRKFPLIIAVVVVITILAIGGVWLITSCANLFCNEIQRNAFVAASSAALGGLCTLTGVAITIHVDSRSKKNAHKEECKPEIYVPDRYDLAQAVKISLVAATNNVPQNALCQGMSYSKSIYLKNSDKASFTILKVETDEGVLEPRIVSHIEKGNLFSLCFYNTWDVSQLSIIVRSADDSYYKFIISSQDERPFIKEVIETNVR